MSKKHNFINQNNIKLLSNYVKYKNYFKNIYLKYDDNTILRIDSSNTEKLLLHKSKIFEEINNKINTNKKDDIFFLDYTENDRNDYSLFLIKKIDYDSSHNFIAFELRVTSINNIIYNPNNDNGLGKSGEAYIVGSDLLLRTSSRFKDNSIKNVQVLTKASQEEIKNKSSTDIIKDYRNIEVLSSYSPLNIKDLNWVIIAEID